MTAPGRKGTLPGISNGPTKKRTPVVSGQAAGDRQCRGACPDREDSGASAHPRRAGGSCRKGAAGRWITGTQTLLMGTLAKGCWRSCDGEPLGFADLVD